MRNEMTIEMACPPGAVFPYIEDNDKLPLWLSGFVVAHWTSVAQTFRHVLEFGGRVLPMTGQVIAREQDRHLAMRLESEVASMRVEYRLVPAGNGTKLTYSCDSQIKGIVRRLFTPVVSWAVQRKIRRDLTRLKEVVETAA